MNFFIWCFIVTFGACLSRQFTESSNSWHKHIQQQKSLGKGLRVTAKLMLALQCKLRNSSITPKNDFYASGDVLFCKFCQHAVDWKHVDVCKDHLQSKAHVNNTVLLLLLTLAGPPRPSDDRRCHKHVSGFKMTVCSVFCGCVWYMHYVVCL